MPKERVGSHRSSRHRHKHSRQDERSHRHRHTPHNNNRASEPQSSTHIYLAQSAERPSISVHTDHVTLASSLSEEGKMSLLFDDCYRMINRWRQERATWALPTNCQFGRLGINRGANLANLATVPQSTTQTKASKARLCEIMDSFKKDSLVPATRTREVIQQSLLLDSETQLESLDVSLYCPLSHSRMVNPVRGKNCGHVHCFDGAAYLSLMWGKLPEKWKCPICKGYTPLHQLVVDGLFLEVLESVPEKCRTVSFTPDGKWRIKEEGSSAPTASNNLNERHTGMEVVDLTFDTPVKMANPKKAEVVSNCYEHTHQVIDLTLSP